MEKDLFKKIDDFVNDRPMYNRKYIEKEQQSFIELFDLTSDIRCYDVLPREAKLDYNYVKELISKYRNRLDLLNYISMYYIENSKDEENVLELAITMLDLNKDNLELNAYYQEIINYHYVDLMADIYTFKSKYADKYEEYQLGMGYGIVFAKYKSEIIRKSYAKRFVMDLVNNSNIDLECMLHAIYHNPEELDEMKRIEFILNLVGVYDINLKEYLYTDSSLFKELDDVIVNIVNNWNYDYCDNYEELKYDFLSKRIWNYLDNENPVVVDDDMYAYRKKSDCSFDEEFVLVNFGKKYGLEDKLVNYYTFDSCTEEEILDHNNRKTAYRDYKFKDGREYHFNVFEKMFIETIFSKEPLWDEYHKYDGITLKYSKKYKRNK